MYETRHCMPLHCTHRIGSSIHGYMVILHEKVCTYYQSYTSSPLITCRHAFALNYTSQVDQGLSVKQLFSIRALRFIRLLFFSHLVCKFSVHAFVPASVRVRFFACALTVELVPIREMVLWVILILEADICRTDALNFTVRLGLSNGRKSARLRFGACAHARVRFSICALTSGNCSEYCSFQLFTTEAKTNILKFFKIYVPWGCGWLSLYTLSYIDFHELYSPS
jgi:hypothetical protein